MMRAAYHDGFKRGERWELNKKSALLEQEAHYMSRKAGKKQEALEMKKEAAKLKSMTKGKRDKTDE